MSATSTGKRHFLTFARFGFVARGILYIVIAILVIGAGRTEDIRGAMRFLGHGAGWVLLYVLAAGMLGYGLWRLSDAAFGTEQVGHNFTGIGAEGSTGNRVNHACIIGFLEDCNFLRKSIGQRNAGVG